MYFLLAAELNPYVALILEHLLSLVGSLVLVAAVPLVHKMAAVFREKTGVEISAKTLAAIDQIVASGVGHAEEWAHKKIKSNEKTTGSEKMGVAISHIESEIKALGLHELGRERLEKLVEAKLGLNR